MAKHPVAVVQAGSRLFDTPATLDEMDRHCREASHDNARLIVFPEAYIGGYPKGLDFGARVGRKAKLSWHRTYAGLFWLSCSSRSESFSFFYRCPKCRS